MIDSKFWKNKRVFVTGHTGFKGSWLVLFLNQLGATVTGYSLGPPTEPSLFDLAHLENVCRSLRGDIRDEEGLSRAMKESAPEVLFHLAAQALVRRSYEEPVETYSTNVMGTVNVLQASRGCNDLQAIVNVTTDKCYENREWPWGYRETDQLGGHDPYASSKGCSELVTASFRDSYFSRETHGKDHQVGLASARAGNVIGGGDWAQDRLVPDCVRAYLAKRRIVVRNPEAVRPWQHVLEPLSGYLLLAQALSEEGSAFAEAWNFGPNEEDSKSVAWLVEKIDHIFPGFPGYDLATSRGPKESFQLRLECAKARQRLGWTPRWNVEKALVSTWEWLDCYLRSTPKIRDLCTAQITEYMQWT